MLEKIRRRVNSIVSKSFKYPKNPFKPSLPSLSSPSPLPLLSPGNTQTQIPLKMDQNRPFSQFLFPRASSSILPDPSRFFSPYLLNSPLPTNSFFQNFTLKSGDQPEYIHPYLIKSSDSAVSVSYPTRFHSPAFVYQAFVPDLTITAANDAPDSSEKGHIICSYSDLSLILDILSSNLRFFLVRGSPYLTCSVWGDSVVSISTIHAIISFEANYSHTKYTIKLNNNQTWLLYSSSPIQLTLDGLSLITSDGFSGIIRIAVLPDSYPEFEPVLDRYSSSYPVSGEASFTKPYCLQYKFEKSGSDDLLMLAHPLHLRILSRDDCNVTILDDFKYKSIDGDLVGVVGDSWVLKPHSVSVTWHSIRGIRENAYDEIIASLCRDVEALNSNSVPTTSSYFYGKWIARAARLALIAEEVGFIDVIPPIRKFLRDTIEPWLNGTFYENGFLYEGLWGGIVTKQGSNDAGADFGFGMYNDHHYHLGYFLYAIAVLVKIDPAWGRRYRPQAYTLMADIMNLSRRADSNYPRLRCFDLYKLHSWAGGLTEFADGRNQESTSEAVNAYYSAALMGLAYGDTHLVTIGSTLTSLEILAAETWWQIKEGDTLYDEDFARENKVVGVLWANKRDSALWFAPPEWRECRLGIQLLPLLPITEILFSDKRFVRELVEWTMPACCRDGCGEGWKGFVYALEGIYNKESALEKIRYLNGFDDGNSRSNLLWWIHSRRDEEEDEEGCGGDGRFCWFGHYCH